MCAHARPCGLARRDRWRGRRCDRRGVGGPRGRAAGLSDGARGVSPSLVSFACLSNPRPTHMPELGCEPGSTALIRLVVVPTPLSEGVTTLWQGLQWSAVTSLECASVIYFWTIQTRPKAGPALGQFWVVFGSKLGQKLYPSQKSQMRVGGTIETYDFCRRPLPIDITRLCWGRTDHRYPGRLPAVYSCTLGGSP